MKKMLRDLGMEAENIHVCINHCVMFWKDLENAIECPTCGASRYKVKVGKDGISRPTKEPEKVSRHFPLDERLKKYYTVPWISEDMTWHDRAKASYNCMRHPIDFVQWQNTKERWTEFASEARNVWLGIST